MVWRDHYWCDNKGLNCWKETMNGRDQYTKRLARRLTDFKAAAEP